MDTFADVAAVAATRRTLHGIAEGLLAGPQHRTCGRLPLRVTPGGFATTGAPTLRLDGGVIVVDERSSVPLGGTFAEVGAATGQGFVIPVDAYADHCDVAADSPVEVEAGTAAALIRWFVVADAGLRQVAPRITPRLWPEHFDVAIEIDEVTYGASPGDGFSPQPYLYVSTSARPANPDPAVWNAPFGAHRPYAAVPPLAEMVAFWTTTRADLESAAG